MNQELKQAYKFGGLTAAAVMTGSILLGGLAMLLGL